MKVKDARKKFAVERPVERENEYTFICEHPGYDRFGEHCVQCGDKVGELELLPNIDLGGDPMSGWSTHGTVSPVGTFAKANAEADRRKNPWWTSPIGASHVPEIKPGSYMVGNVVDKDKFAYGGARGIWLDDPDVRKVTLEHASKEQLSEMARALGLEEKDGDE